MYTDILNDKNTYQKDAIYIIRVERKIMAPTYNIS